MAPPCVASRCLRAAEPVARTDPFENQVRVHAIRACNACNRRARPQTRVNDPLSLHRAPRPTLPPRGLRTAKSSFHTTRVSPELTTARAASSPRRAETLPLTPSSVKIRWQPAAVSASRCKARFWSRVETRAYPINIPSCGTKFRDAQGTDLPRNEFCPEKGRLPDTRALDSGTALDRYKSRSGLRPCLTSRPLYAKRIVICRQV